LIINYGIHIQIIPYTCPHQISFFRVMLHNIESCASTFPLIYSFVSLSTYKSLLIVLIHPSSLL
jgi:hypothetical protein